MSALFFLSASVFAQHNQLPEKIKPRVYFKARLEPKDKVISGAGQANIQSFDNYVKALSPQTRPVIIMEYVGLNLGMKSKNSVKETFANWFKRKIDALAPYDWQVIPQIGLSMTKDGQPELHYEHNVAAGEYDAQIEGLCLALKALKRPCYLRIGYEFNGGWNGYQPETYKAAYIRIVEALRKHQIKNVATVWCFAVDGKVDDFMPYYPGDAYVDWWGIDVFGEDHFKQPETQAFLDSALLHRKPVMIGESTPRRVDVQGGETSWNRWFKPYFDMIHNNPHIKAFSYINWNWKDTQWPDWGDGRLEENDFVRQAFLKEMQNGLYMHGTTVKQTDKLLKVKY